MKRSMDIYISKLTVLIDILIIISDKLNGALVYTDFPSQDYNIIKLHNIAGINGEQYRSGKYPKETRFIRCGCSENILKELQFPQRLMDRMDLGDTLASKDVVTKQYENLPYPPFTEYELKAEEKWYKNDKEMSNFIAKSLTLQKINHYLHRGNEDFMNAYRMIIAGGGTGAMTVFSGEQLNHTNGEVVYMDFSETSMKISKKRAHIRRLQNIIWIRSWIEDVRYLGLGLFDLLQCSGVLHHLKDPLFGLKVLKDTLYKNGGMSLMVYGKYGRTAVYQIQSLMKMINQGKQELETEIDHTTLTIDALPQHNWFIKNTIVGDHLYGDIGIYDLFLHKRDISFSITTLFQWIEKGGIHFSDFDSFEDRFNLKIKYQFHENDLKRKASMYLKRKTSMYDESKQLSFTEFLYGRLIKHEFYASKLKSSVADLHDMSNVLYFYGTPHGFRLAVANRQNIVTLDNQTFFHARMSPSTLTQSRSHYQTMRYEEMHDASMNTKIFNFKWNNFSRLLINRLLESNRGVKLKSLYKEYRNTIDSNISDDELKKSSEDFYISVKDTEMFLLKKNYANAFPKTSFGTYFIINSL